MSQGGAGSEQRCSKGEEGEAAGRVREGGRVAYGWVRQVLYKRLYNSNKTVLILSVFTVCYLLNRCLLFFVQSFELVDEGSSLEFILSFLSDLSLIHILYLCVYKTFTAEPVKTDRTVTLFILEQ